MFYICIQSANLCAYFNLTINEHYGIMYYYCYYIWSYFKSTVNVDLISFLIMENVCVCVCGGMMYPNEQYNELQ